MQRMPQRTPLITMQRATSGLFHYLPATLASLLLGACSTRTSPDYQRTISHAIAASTDSTLHRDLSSALSEHAGLSGFRLITTGEDAFYTRIAMTRAAEHTLDLQYYIADGDMMKKFFLEEILRAANRGVRVRILLDYLHFKDPENRMTALDAHKNVEIRGFNPLTDSTKPLWNQLTAWFSDIGRYNKRMHNKAIIADNQVAITGGRNLGDEYFDQRADFNFSDLDVLSIGPIVPRVSASFDRYWNSDEAYPLELLGLQKPDEAARNNVYAKIRQGWNDTSDTQQLAVLAQPQVDAWLHNGRFKMVWARAELSVDAPEKVQTPTEDADSHTLNHMDGLLQNAKQEFIAVTPYFVPQEDGVEWLSDFRKRGVRVRILTNSLASTDAPIVHTGYSRYRKPLLESGIELFELKPIPGKRSRQRLTGSATHSRSSLHSKVYVIDREHVLISSLNLDPRSIQLNTELTLAIHSKELAAQVVKMFEESTHSSDSYRLRLAKLKSAKDAQPEIIWETTEKGKPVYYRRDPQPGVWRSISAAVYSLLPVEDHL